MLFALIASLVLLVPSVGADVICEELPQGLCAYAVNSYNKRCVLESNQRGNGRAEYQCRTSEVVVNRLADYVEREECVSACGIDRYTVSISSDALLESQFTVKLCSPECYQNCPNIIDFYFNLAAGEGVFLPDLCAARRENPHRAMLEILSSGAVSGPLAGGESSLLDETDQMGEIADVPAPAPVFNGEASQIADVPAPPSPLAYL